jgi:hypothetical protein
MSNTGKKHDKSNMMRLTSVPLSSVRFFFWVASYFNMKGSTIFFGTLEIGVVCVFFR